MALSLPIPVDIVYTILDELSSDAACLQQCALVSRAFLSHCHKLLFSHIRLDHPRQSRGLHRAISNNASIACFIRTLEVVASVQPEFRLRDWVTIEQTLAPLIQMLYNLDSFTFRSTFQLPLPWQSLPVDLRSAILELSAPSITLEYLANLPIAQFMRLTRLKSLSLIHIWTDPSHPLDSAPLQTSPQTFGYLETLEILGSPTCGKLLVSVLTHRRSSLKLSQLKTLALYGNHELGGAILDVAGQTLQRVVLGGLGEDRNFQFVAFPSSFSTLPSLRSLTLSTKFARGHAHDPLPLIARALAGATPSDTCALTHLEVHIDFYGVWKFAITPRDVDAVDEYAFWPAIDQALTRPRVYTRLETVRIGLKVGGGGEAFARLPRRRMPALVEMGVLRMVFTDK
ncbi:hypothetical protein DXG03_008626 [Asterophora parasitica]|uniref:Uncharacterized protein n=1 Tax=Asterophora parasitica TaxID=117018 RepID=A0A9P7FYM3_9AGAR|nr:hypothetical protein DXG03_008626 [Asterophora parasitica]